MNLTYSKMNQQWFLIWGNQVIERYERRYDALLDLRYKGLLVSSRGAVTVDTDGKEVN